MDNLKIRLKLRENEFEAEGPDALIRAHLGEFKALLKGEEQAKNGSLPTDLLFKTDAGGERVTLRVLPSTDRGRGRQVANTLLLALYGFQEQLGLQEVPVLSAAQSLRHSGLVKVQRLSNAFLVLQREGHAMKVGSGKGTRYKLTAKGHAAAQNLYKTTLARADLG